MYPPPLGTGLGTTCMQGGHGKSWLLTCSVPFHRQGRENNVVLVMTDHFTCWCDAIPVPDDRAVTVAKALDERVLLWDTREDPLRPGSVVSV